MPRRVRTIEERILAALRVSGRALTVSQLHGPGMPGLTCRLESEIWAAVRRLEATGAVRTLQAAEEDLPKRPGGYRWPARTFVALHLRVAP